MNALNRSRSPSAWFSTALSLSPTFSRSPSGSYSRDKCMEVFLAAAHIFEGHRARVGCARRGGPCDLAVGHLLDDPGLPLATYPGDLGDTFRPIVAELPDALYLTRELRKILELCPLVTGSTCRHIDQNRRTDLPTWMLTPLPTRFTQNGDCIPHHRAEGSGGTSGPDDDSPAQTRDRGSVIQHQQVLLS